MIDILSINGEVARAILLEQGFLAPATIPGGVYRGIGARATLSLAAQWFTTADVDDDLVYDITKALWHAGNRKLLDGGHPKGRQIRLESALEGLSIPLHDGARRFYRERGLIK